MTGQVTSYLNEVGDHSAQPPSPDMTLIALLVLQRFLSNHAEQIVSDHRQFQYQGVCAKRQSVKREAGSGAIRCPLVWCAGHGAHLTGESPVAGIYRQA